MKTYSVVLVFLALMGLVHSAAADDEPQLLARVIERVEHRQIALAGNAEGELDALSDEVVDEYLAAGAHHEGE